MNTTRPNGPVFSTARLEVRMGEPRDEESIALFQQRNLAHFAGMRPLQGPEVVTAAFWSRRLIEDAEAFAKDAALRLFAFSRQDQSRVIALINLTNIVRGPLQSAYLGYGIDQEFEGRGLMSEALVPVLAFAFAELHLHRVMANYRPENVRSGRLLRALGFTVEGYARDYLYLEGAWADHILTSIVNDAWFV